MMKGVSKNIPQGPKISAVFLMNVKAMPNKAKRFDKDKKHNFNL